MTNEELELLFKGKSEEWLAGFCSAVNLNSDMKAAFLKSMIGQHVEVVERNK